MTELSYVATEFCRRAAVDFKEAAQALGISFPLSLPGRAYDVIENSRPALKMSCL
jgi:hypothetical protein